MTARQVTPGVCPARGCGLPLPVWRAVPPKSYLPCPACARLAQGRCHTCNGHLSREDRAGNRRWCAPCRYRRRDAARQLANGRAWYARHPDAQRARTAAYYAEARDVLALKQRARSAARAAAQNARRARAAAAAAVSPTA